MLQMNVDFPLKEIDISDTPEEEVLLVSDLPITRQMKFAFILPIFLFVILNLVSIFLPSAEFTQYVEENLTTSSQFQVWNTVSQMAPIYKYISLIFNLKRQNSDLKSTLNGSASIKIYDNGILLKNFNKNISNHLISEPLIILTDQLIVFDKIITVFNFSTSDQLSDEYSSIITTNTMSTICSLFICFTRILFSLFLFFLFFGSTNFIVDIDESINNDDKNNEKVKKSPKTIEQKITFFLILSAFFYADPFDIINLSYPSKFSRTFQIFLRDFFYSYLVFYIHALFSYFTREPFENQLISLLFPYLFMSICLILFWINDADIYLHNITNVFPNPNQSSLLLDKFPDFPTLENLSTLHLLYFLFLLLSTIVQIIITGIKVKKNQIEHMQRWIFYTSTSLSFLILLSIYAILEVFFTNLIDHTIFEQSYVLIVSLCYVMIMEFGHEETKVEKKDIYILQAEDNNPRNSGLIGGTIDHSLDVDEDLEKLKEKENKSNTVNKSKDEEIKPPEIRVQPVQTPISQTTSAPTDSQN